MRKYNYKVGDYVLIKPSTIDYDGFRHLIGTPVRIEELLEESYNCSYKISICGIREEDIMYGGGLKDYPELFL